MGIPTAGNESKTTWPIFVVMVTLVGCMVAYKTVKEPTEQEPTAIVEASPEPDSASTPPTPSPIPSTIRIASWNVLNLGENTPVDLRAEVISQFVSRTNQSAISPPVHLSALSARTPLNSPDPLYATCKP